MYGLMWFLPRFTMFVGAKVVRQMLSELDLPELRKRLQEDFSTTASEVKNKNIIKRFKLVENFLESENKPEWMIMTVLPIIQPENRPLVIIDEGRFATSDLIELYRKVNNRNNRLTENIIGTKSTGYYH